MIAELSGGEGCSPYGRLEVVTERSPRQDPQDPCPGDSLSLDRHKHGNKRQTERELYTRQPSGSYRFKLTEQTHRGWKTQGT